MQKSPIGAPIHTNVGFRVAKVALAGRFGSNGQEVGQPHRRRVEADARVFDQPGEEGGVNATTAAGISGLRLNPFQVVGFDLMADRQHLLPREIFGWFTGLARYRAEELLLPGRRGGP